MWHIETHEGKQKDNKIPVELLTYLGLTLNSAVNGPRLYHTSISTKASKVTTTAGESLSPFPPTLITPEVTAVLRELMFFEKKMSIGYVSLTASLPPFLPNLSNSSRSKLPNFTFANSILFVHAVCTSFLQYRPILHSLPRTSLLLLLCFIAYVLLLEGNHWKN